MVAVARLTDEEAYLAAVLDDPSGIELAELTWVDEEADDRCYRVWDFQHVMYGSGETYQIDQCGRSLGKSVGIIMRAYAFPFHYPGAEMLITAPELNHLRPIVDKVENLFLTTRLGREMLPKDKGRGINHQPQFQARFINNARIISRLPNRDGKGVKGCVMEDTRILTRSGHVAAQDVRVGDEVLTHLGRWRPVKHIYRYEDTDGVAISGGGIRRLVVSDNHRLLVRYNRNPQRTRSLLGPEWIIPAEDDVTRYYAGSPATFPAAPTPEWVEGPELAWVLGRYTADGHLTFFHKPGGWTSGRIHVIAESADLDEITTHIKAARRKGSVRLRENGTYDIEFSDTDLARHIQEEIGRSALSKRMPTWLLSAPEPVRQAYLEGLLSGDGSFDAGRERWTLSTASYSLAMDVKLLVQSLGLPASVTWVDPKQTHVMGVELKRAPQRSYRVMFTKRGHPIIEDGKQWSKLRETELITGITVYDFVVAEDHSYVGDTLIHMGSPFLPDNTEA